MRLQSEYGWERFLIFLKWAGQADILIPSIHLEQSLTWALLSLSGLMGFVSSTGLGQAGVTPSPGQHHAMEPGRAEEPFPCLYQPVPVTMGAQRMWELVTRCLVQQEGEWGLAADEPSVANDFPRVLLCSGSELSTQRWKAPSLTGLLIVQTTTLVLKWN